MVAFMVYQIVCLFILTHTTCGLLSEYKICGDAECESRMSRVQAIQDHYNKDCRFLSFRQGDIIFVYHKLTGKREDLWAGTIDRKFGYFPKHAVKEEEIYAKTEKILETQRSDFICTDENGYPIDTSELDDNANHVYLSETTQAVPTTQQSSSQESHQTTTTTETKSRPEADSKDVETLNEQAESPWLKSSMTGLWELVQKDDIANEDEKDNMGESSLTSSVTGWLGFGAKQNGENSQETKVQDTEASRTIGSSVTGWLGFGSDSKNHEKDQEDLTKSVQDDKSVEVFRGRKIALDLQEDNQFDSEEKKETGTLDWIGNGISSTLGFGLSTKESGQESASDDMEKELQPASSSWFDVGVTDMLGFRRGVVKENDQMQKDPPVVEQDTILNFPSQKQPEVIDAEIVQTEAKTNINTNLDADLKESNEEYNHIKRERVMDIQINASRDSDPDVNQDHKEDNLQTSETSSNENKLSPLSDETVKLKDPNETDEGTVLSTNSGPSHGLQVIYDQDNQDYLQLERNAIEANTDLQIESTPDQLTQNGSESEMSETELPSNERETIPKIVGDVDYSKVSETENPESVMGQQIQDESGDEKLEEMGSVITQNDIQEVVNAKPDMTENMIETKQDLVGGKSLQDEFMVDKTGETEKIFENLDQVKINIKPQDTNEDREGNRNKLNVGHEKGQNYEDVSEKEKSEEIVEHQENIQELVAEPCEDGKLKIKEEWQLDGVTQAANVESDPEWLAKQESSGQNLDTTHDLNNVQAVGEWNDNFDETVKKNGRQHFKEDIDFKEKVDSASMEDLQEIVSINDRASKNNQESTSLEEVKPYPNEEINQLLFDVSEIDELYDQRDKDYNIKEDHSETELNIKSSNHGADLNIAGNKMTETDSRTDVYKAEEEMGVAASQNVLNETTPHVPFEPTASSDINGENVESSGLLNSALDFIYSTNSETTGLNSESEEPQVKMMIKEDDDLINNAKDIANSQTIFPSIQFPGVQSATVTTLNPKTLHKLYDNILATMNANDLEILIYHFGDHKLQFLDYILGSLNTATGENDADTSILLDIKRLLNYHMERLTVTSESGNVASEKDNDKSRTFIALQKLELVLEKVEETFSMIKADEQDIWIRKDKEINNENMETHGMRDIQTEDQRHDTKGAKHQILDLLDKTSADTLGHIHAALELITWLKMQVVSALPDDIRPGPDLYGVPWEPVIISGLVGLVTVLVFICRCYSSVKSRTYRSKERCMAEQVAQLLDEKCKVLETLSRVQQEYNSVEDSLRDSGVLAQTQKTIQLEAKANQLEHAKKEFESDLQRLKDQLNQQRQHRLEEEQRIMALEESVKTCEEETKVFQSQEEQGQTTLKVYSMNSDRLQRNLETAGEENALLQENNGHLRQQLDGWAERVSELEEDMRRCEHAHSGMLQDVATKDERIMSLTDRLLQMRAWDSDLEEEQGTKGEKETSNGTAASGETNGAITDPQGHLQKVQKLIHAAKLNADLKSVDEDKDRIFAKLNDEVKAKEDLQGSIKDLENEKLSLHSDTIHFTDQAQVLQQKLQIMTEMYQENELKLHRLLTVEEKERLQKEEKLTKADKNIAMAMEELTNYRQRAEEMEEELEKTKQSYQTQISSHEKKAHNNWLAARSAERELSEIRRENTLLRNKLTDTQFKLEAIEKDPYALDSLARPLPFRGRPASETRAFLSPPTLMDGPPNRLSPRVVMRGPLEPTGDMERTGGPHSDSGSISPIWERDRRGPPPGPMSGPMPGGPLGSLPGPFPGLPGNMAPPGYIFSEPGGPVYRRPPPGTMGLHPAPGPLPPRFSRPPGPPIDMTDGPYRETSLAPGEHDHLQLGAGERRTPPEADLRMGGMAPPGPAMGPMDGPFPRRGPYGPPPPEYYLPRGPGGPPMPAWGPPPPGMLYPPRFPSGGPPPPHMPPYSGPPVRPPVSDEHRPQPPLPAPAQRQSSEEHSPSPQDII